MQFARVTTVDRTAARVRPDAVACVEAQPGATCVIYFVGGRFVEVEGDLDEVMTQLGLNGDGAPEPGADSGGKV